MRVQLVIYKLLVVTFFTSVFTLKDNLITHGNHEMIFISYKYYLFYNNYKYVFKKVIHYIMNELQQRNISNKTLKQRRVYFDSIIKCIKLYNGERVCSADCTDIEFSRPGAQLYDIHKASGEYSSLYECHFCEIKSVFLHPDYVSAVT